jgi:lipopolysaccharide exporter
MTDDSASILAKTARGAGWVVAWRMITRTLGLLSTLVLVRLLAPSDFGLVALATSFSVAIEAFSWIGTEEGVIRHNEPTREVYDTAFTIALLRGSFVGLLIAAAAYPGAAFFGDQRLACVLLALAATAVIESLTNIGIVQFRRDFTFQKEFQLWLLPRILSIVIAIALAAATRSYWALIAGIMSNQLFRVLFSYAMHPYRPRLRLTAWRELAGYSAWNSLVAGLQVLPGRIDTLLIGRMLDPTRVGVYAVGYEIAELPVTELISPLTRSAFAGFAAARRAEVDAGETWLRLVAAAGLLTLPAGVGMSAVAHPLILLAFGPGWAQAVPVVQIVSLAICLTVFGILGQTVFMAHAYMRTTVAITATGLVVRVALLATLIPAFGLVGAAVGAALGVVTEQGLSAFYAMRRLGVGPIRDLLPLVWRCLAATAAMATALWAAGLGWRPFEVIWLAAAVGLGAAIYTLVLAGLWAACGRPAGPEADVLALAAQGLRRRRAA